MNKKLEAHQSQNAEEEYRNTLEEQLVSLSHRINELSQFVTQTRDNTPSHIDDSVVVRWRAVMDRILKEAPEPSIWIRDASIQNLADGGHSLTMKIHVVDGAWLTTTEHGPLVHHHYEVEFYAAEGAANGSIRGKIAVTFSLLFSVFGHEFGEEFFELESKVDRARSDFDKSGLYHHSWPRLRSFVEGLVDEFFWDKLSLPDTLDTSELPIASVYVGNTVGY